MLTLISYVFGLLTALALILCIASGLWHICVWIEEHPSRSRKIGRRLTEAVAILTLLTSFTDSLPWLFALSCFCVHLFIFVSLDEQTWHRFGHIWRALAHCCSPLIPHLVLLQRFHPLTQAALLQRSQADTPHPAYADKTKLPGGRMDWDAYPPASSSSQAARMIGTGEQLVCFAFCWIPTLWALLITIADSWSLPLAHSGERKSLTRKRRSSLVL